MEYSEYWIPRYTLRQASLAAAFPLNTLRSNFQRGWFRSFATEAPPGRGRALRLCLGDILILAIASRLIDLGYRPLDAWNAAHPFALVTHQSKSGPRRRAFELFDRQRFDSVFVWSNEHPQRIIAVPKGEGIPIDQLRLDETFGTATVIMPLGSVEATVFRKLGLPQPGQPDAA